MQNPRVIKKSSGVALAPGQRVRVGTEAVAAPDESPLCATSRVELIREGDIVRRIDVHCRCGEVIQLLCDYLEEADTLG